MIEIDKNLSIGEAVDELQDGRKVCRTGWNGKNMHLYLVAADGDHDAFVMMKTAKDTHIPWLCSQADLLARDWEVVA